MNLLLPFTLKSEDRIKKINNNMEKAAVFCLSEIERNKGGLIWKKHPEEIRYISRVCYPIWRTPSGGTSLLFDGLGLKKHTISYETLPNVSVFTKEATMNANNEESYLDFLTHNINYFENFAGKANKVIEGLIADSSLLNAFHSYFLNARPIKGQVSRGCILTPFLDSQKIESSSQAFSELKNDLKEDIKKLNKITWMIMKFTEKHIKSFRKRNVRIQKRNGKKVEKVKTQVIVKTDRLRLVTDKKILKVRKSAEKELTEIQKNLENLNQQKTQLESYSETCKNETSRIIDNQDEKEFDFWKVELEKTELAMQEIASQISDVSNRIVEINKALDIEIAKIESEFNAKSKTFQDQIKRIEDSRDNDISNNEEKIRVLKESSTIFAQKVQHLVELKKKEIDSLEKLGIQKVTRKSCLVYVPFYLTSYQQESKKRYLLHPPSFTHGMRGVTKIKGVFKTSKITVIFEEISDSITKFLNIFVRLLSQQPVFEEKLEKAGLKTNILKTQENRSEVKNGLQLLRNEGWLSEAEYLSCIDKLENI